MDTGRPAKIEHDWNRAPPLRTMRRRSARREPLGRAEIPALQGLTAPVFSPDGTRIAYTVVQGLRHHWAVWSVNNGGRECFAQPCCIKSLTTDESSRPTRRMRRAYVSALHPTARAWPSAREPANRICAFWKASRSKEAVC